MDNRARTWFLISVMVVLLAIGIGFGIYTYRQDTISDINVIDSEKLAGTQTSNFFNEQSQNELIEASSVSEKISPNAVIIEKRYYQSCDHLIRETLDIPRELINQEREELERFYSGWNVEQFSPTEIVISKEYEGMCNEHYVVKEHNGVLGIFIENDEKVQEWQEDTEIDIQYLPDEDIEEFKTGVKVVGKINLISFLENFE